MFTEVHEGYILVPWPRCFIPSQKLRFGMAAQQHSSSLSICCKLQALVSNSAQACCFSMRRNMWRSSWRVTLQTSFAWCRAQLPKCRIATDAHAAGDVAHSSNSRLPTSPSSPPPRPPISHIPSPLPPFYSKRGSSQFRTSCDSKVSGD